MSKPDHGAAEADVVDSTLSYNPVTPCCAVPAAKVT